MKSQFFKRIMWTMVVSSSLTCTSVLLADKGDTDAENGEPHTSENPVFGSRETRSEKGESESTGRNTGSRETRAESGKSVVELDPSESL